MESTNNLNPDYILSLIAEGYYHQSVSDRYVVVNNPDFTEDNGNNPYLVYDTFGDWNTNG